MNCTIVTFAAFFLSWFTPLAFGSFLDLPEAFNFSQNVLRKDHTSYLSPNERQNRDQARIWRNAPTGLHIAVGTERGFMGAAVNSKASHVLLLDHDANVVLFNRINIALLQRASDSETYRALRFATNREAWAEAGVEISDEGWDFWQQNVIHNAKFNDFHQDTPGYYPEGNYLYDESLFQRLSQLAREEKIEVVHIDLTDSENLNRIIHRIKRVGLKLSLIDISNAGDKSYIRSPKVLSQVFEDFSRIAQPHSLLVTSRWVHLGNFPIKSWDFFAYRFKYVSSFPLATATYLQAHSNRPAREQEQLIDPQDYTALFDRTPKPSLLHCLRLLIF